MVDELVNEKREGVVCELDMEKAHDHVNWSFMDYMLMRMCFTKK